MFNIVGMEEFRDNYTTREDCAGVNFCSDLRYGNLVFLKKAEGSDVYYTIAQILYFKIIGKDIVVQDKEFFSYYR